MYEIKTEIFQGPFSLLLQLIEQEKLDITDVSLAHVTDQYLARVENLGEDINPAELADFLVIASRLLVIKSHILLPSLSLEDEEADDLEHRLKMYKAYRDASEKVRAIIKKKHFSYSRQIIKLKTIASFSPPEKFDATDMAAVLRILIKELEHTVSKLPKTQVQKIISIGQRIAHLKEMLSEVEKIGFKDFLKTAKNKSEIVVSFLALLELIKQRELVAEQQENQIVISKV
jgi:segregation and condensation protein A|tara:strand:- start:216 stop:908 length:693 start_codon:yes stop_codon:yes gene_type:complete